MDGIERREEQAAKESFVGLAQSDFRRASVANAVSIDFVCESASFDNRRLAELPMRMPFAQEPFEPLMKPRFIVSFHFWPTLSFAAAALLRLVVLCLPIALLLFLLLTTLIGEVIDHAVGLGWMMA